MSDFPAVPEGITGENGTAEANARAFLDMVKRCFPGAVKDGSVDIRALEEEIGGYAVPGSERYEFTWAGKQAAKKEAQSDIYGRTLRYKPQDGVDTDKTKNLYIEGDNLEVMKLLRVSCRAAVKMIYIDPPYNTGNDFVYRDKFAMSEKELSELSGERVKRNASDGARYHTNWLNMMYPRLRVARELLADDGVIFISIDDNEVGNLRKICDEIFGEENFEGHIHWRRRHNQPNDKTKMIALVAEHILAYARSSAALRAAGVGKIDVTGEFSNPDGDPRGDWASKPWKVGSDQSGSRYTIITPTGKELDEEWMGERATFEELLADNRIIFPRGGDGMPRKKYFRSEREAEGQCATNWWESARFGHNQGANDLMTELFGVKNVFSNPKPVELIRGLMQIANVKDGDTVLDFFSGSASTAHAVMQFNSETGSSVRFIMIQLPEDLGESLSEASGKTRSQISAAVGFLDSINKPRLISEIGKERIRRAAAKIAADRPGAVFDGGFKVFEAANTNIRWLDGNDADITGGLPRGDPDRLDFTEGASDIDVVYEIMLRQYGVSLSSPVERTESVGGRTYAFGSTVVCLEPEISDGLIERLAAAEPSPSKIVLRDSAFGDDIALKETSYRKLTALTGSGRSCAVEFI